MNQSTLVSRRFASDAGPQFLDLVRDIVSKEMQPRVADFEARSMFPSEVYRTLGDAGLLGMTAPESVGGAALPYHDYLQLLEEIATGWLSVGIGVSVQTLATFPLIEYGTVDQQQQFATQLTAGQAIGAYCLSEPHCGSDAAALTTSAQRHDDSYLVNGVKAWTTHGGVADLYNVMVRTSDDGAGGITCLLVEADVAGVRPDPPEHKMAAGASPTASIRFDEALIPVAQQIGAVGEGFTIAMGALDAGRLGIAACAVGLAQAAMDYAVHYADERVAFNKPISSFQGVSFKLADMATDIAAARALYLDAADRLDAGQPFSTHAAMAKVFATDAAMRITTDAVQVLGGAGYVSDHPVERWFREAKVLQIVEGTNEIQRVVIGRALRDTSA